MFSPVNKKSQLLYIENSLWFTWSVFLIYSVTDSVGTGHASVQLLMMTYSIAIGGKRGRDRVTSLLSCTDQIVELRLSGRRLDRAVPRTEADAGAYHLNLRVILSLEKAVKPHLVYLVSLWCNRFAVMARSKTLD